MDPDLALNVAYLVILMQMRIIYWLLTRDQHR
jgi:hypothetical protein